MTAGTIERASAVNDVDCGLQRRGNCWTERDANTPRDRTHHITTSVIASAGT